MAPGVPFANVLSLRCSRNIRDLFNNRTRQRLRPLVRGGAGAKIAVSTVAEKFIAASTLLRSKA